MVVTNFKRLCDVFWSCRPESPEVARSFPRMASVNSIVELCRNWTAGGPPRVVPMPVSGFSGSRVFVVELPETGARFVLKCFHAAATTEHARFVHGLARHLRAEGLSQVPEVMRTSHGDTIVADADGRLWELCRFIRGRVIPRPSPPQAAAAARALARLHLAAARLSSWPPRLGSSRGLVERISRARMLLDRPWHDRLPGWVRLARGSMDRSLRASLEVRAVASVELFAACGGDAFLRGLSAMQAPVSMLQPVLRDIWHEHVLFASAGDAVTGMIDLHAAGIDTPATDLARLFGSWEAPAGSERSSLSERWPQAFDSYQEVRPLSAAEVRMIPVLHAGVVVFGIDNWFRWLFDEHRTFSNIDGPIGRLDSLLETMPGAIAAAWRQLENVD